VARRTVGLIGGRTHAKRQETNNTANKHSCHVTSIRDDDCDRGRRRRLDRDSKRCRRLRLIATVTTPNSPPRNCVSELRRVGVDTLARYAATATRKFRKLNIITAQGNAPRPVSSRSLQLASPGKLRSTGSRTPNRAIHVPKTLHRAGVWPEPPQYYSLENVRGTRIARTLRGKSRRRSMTRAGNGTDFSG